MNNKRDMNMSLIFGQLQWHVSCVTKDAISWAPYKYYRSHDQVENNDKTK